MMLSFFTSANLKNAGFFLAGLVSGALIVAFIYLAFVLKDLKRAKQANAVQSDVVVKKKVKLIHQRAQVDLEAIAQDIAFAKAQYDNDLAQQPMERKYEGMKCLLRELMTSIASAYYPHSPHPLAELSPLEYLKFTTYITDSINHLLDRPFLRSFAALPVTDYLSLMDLKKKYDENRALKLARRVQLPQFAAAALTILNYVNPVFWVKKLVTSTVIPLGVNHIAHVIIDYVGDETYHAFSKHLFLEMEQKNVSEAGEDEKDLKKLIEEAHDAQ